VRFYSRAAVARTADFRFAPRPAAIALDSAGCLGYLQAADFGGEAQDAHENDHRRN
jgi:hypothetical protein